ncbi:unnamed protein product [Cunninghamella blakesleeana]
MSNINQEDISGPPSPVSSTEMASNTHSPLSSKRAREISLSSESDELQQYERVNYNSYDTEDEQLENAVADWDCNDKDTKSDPKEQLEFIEKTNKDAPLVEGEAWYIISQKWYRRWRQSCARISSSNTDSQSLGSQTHPGSIDNSDILSSKNELLPGSLLSEEKFIIVPEIAWQHLDKW